MAGGLVQLQAKGTQDMFLTTNPTITFFKAVYRKHTNFAMEAIKQTFNGTVDFGRNVNALISRNADLLFRTWLQVQLPAITASSGTVAWTRSVGHTMIKNVEVSIGGQTIDKHYGTWLTIWNELTQKAEHMDSYNVMIGNTAALTTPAATIPSAQLYIPLQFWFCRNPGLALPLVALSFHDVKIAFEFRPYSELIIGSVAGTPSLGDTTLWTDYIYLDVDERTQFSQDSHEYLIEILQYSGGEGFSNSSVRPKLPYNHPTKELVWVCQLDANVSGGANRWSDFTNSGTNTSAFYKGGDTMVSGNIQVNGQDRFAVRDAQYFNQVQPYQHHTSSPSTGIYSYSFALNPEKYQPSGSINLSRIDTTTLALTLSSSAQGNLHVFAWSYNILRITSGMGGLAFSN